VQNNNANAFPNGMGGDFGFQLWFQYGPIWQLSTEYPSGDFQMVTMVAAMAERRGRAVAALEEGRGNFNQYSQYQHQVPEWT